MFMSKCMACGVEKDEDVKEAFPYPDFGIIDGPIDPFFHLDCEPRDGKKHWRRVRVCHECLYKLEPDMWISSQCWERLDPVVPFEDLPILIQRTTLSRR